MEVLDRNKHTVDISEAVRVHCQPGAYSCSGELERLGHKIDALTGVVGLLLEIIAKKGLLRDIELEEILGYEYSVPEHQK
jgi:hypothetical protein